MFDSRLCCRSKIISANFICMYLIHIRVAYKIEVISLFRNKRSTFSNKCLCRNWIQNAVVVQGWDNICNFLLLFRMVIVFFPFPWQSLRIGRRILWYPLVWAMQWMVVPAIYLHLPSASLVHSTTAYSDHADLRFWFLYSRGRQGSFQKVPT